VGWALGKHTRERTCTLATPTLQPGWRCVTGGPSLTPTIRVWGGGPASWVVDARTAALRTHSPQSIITELIMDVRGGESARVGLRSEGLSQRDGSCGASWVGTTNLWHESVCPT
jgi:hypothetical protein